MLDLRAKQAEMTSKLYIKEKKAEFKWNQHSMTMKTRDPVHVAPVRMSSLVIFH